MAAVNPIVMAAAAGFLMVGGVAIASLDLDRPRILRRRRTRLSTVTGTVRRGLLVWALLGLAAWAVTGWPVVAVAVLAAGWGLPWLLGSAAVVEARLDRLEALEGWCRRMADMLSGGGAVGLAQAVAVSAERIDPTIAGPVGDLARRLRLGHDDPDAALRAFADAIDDRIGDSVAAALLLALHAQTPGIARVLRQLADGVAGDVRARREIEAERAENRQSIRMLLLIQAGILVFLAVLPGFAEPYGTPVGQAVMLLLLAGTTGLLVWMRKLALGRPEPRYFGQVGLP